MRMAESKIQEFKALSCEPYMQEKKQHIRKEGLSLSNGVPQTPQFFRYGK